MDVASAERRSGSQIDRYPLLMEQVASHTRQQHVIDVEANNDASSSSSHDDQHPGVDSAEHEDSLSSGIPASSNQSDENSSNRLNASNSSMRQGGDGYRQNHRSPLNSGLWISVELVVTVGQIIASVVVLSLSIHENPQAPLFVWVVGYASGCVATLPLLYWRYCSRMRGSEQESNESRQGTSHSNRTEPRSYTAISVTQSSDEDSQQTGEPASRNGQIVATLNSRFNGLVDHFKMALDCFFAVWFVVGNVWIFGGHSSPSDAPKLYRLCIVFLTFSCIGYAMPFILCATICCCLPCIMSVLGFREDFSQTRGATLESINALPTYKFKLKQDLSAECGDVNPGRSEGGVLAVGTEKERFMSGEDAVCCICLARYADDDELKELPCFHVFHVECIDKWLKINALCPLCKKDISESSRSSLSDGDRGG